MTQGLKQIPCVLLVDPTSGVPLGLVGNDGKEYLLAPLTANGQGATTPSIQGTPIGSTTPSTGRFTTVQVGTFTDTSGTPGNATINQSHGRAAFAAAASSVTITDNFVGASSTVLVQLGGTDATLKSVTVTAAAGSFTVTGNAAATGTTPFDFVVLY